MAVYGVVGGDKQIDRFLYKKVFGERCERRLQDVIELLVVGANELLVVRVNERLLVLNEIGGRGRGVYMHFWCPWESL